MVRVTSARDPDQNIADITAQLAANAKGVRELHAMIRHFGRDTVAAYMRHVQNNAEACVRAVIDRLRDGHNVVELDNGARIRVAITVDAGRLFVDLLWQSTLILGLGLLAMGASRRRKKVV